MLLQVQNASTVFRISVKGHLSSWNNRWRWNLTPGRWLSIGTRRHVAVICSFAKAEICDSDIILNCLWLYIHMDGYMEGITTSVLKIMGIWGMCLDWGANKETVKHIYLYDTALVGLSVERRVQVCMLWVSNNIEFMTSYCFWTPPSNKEITYRLRVFMRKPCSCCLKIVLLYFFFFFFF